MSNHLRESKSSTKKKKITNWVIKQAQTQSRAKYPTPKSKKLWTENWPQTIEANGSDNVRVSDLLPFLRVGVKISGGGNNHSLPTASIERKHKNHIEQLKTLVKPKILTTKRRERETHAWASLVVAKGSHWPIESVSLIAEIENWKIEREKEKKSKH